MDQSILIWGIVIILGLPGLAILLIECKGFFERRGSLFAPVITKVWRYVFPCVALLLVMTQLLQLSANQLPVKVVETGFWLAAIFTLLSLVNAIFTPKEPKVGTLQFQIPNIFFQAARITVVLLLLAQLLGNTWNINVGGIFQALGVGSVVIALALQDTLSSLVSGFFIVITKPFKIGDWIEFGGTKARVIDQNWWSVTLENKTWDYKITVPNGMLAKAQISNYEKKGIWQEVTISFSYDDSPNRVIPILESMGNGIEGLECPLWVGVASYDDSSIKYSIWFKALPEKAGIYYKLTSRLYFIAQRHNLTMPYPIEINYQIEAPEGLPSEIPKAPDNHQLEMASYLRALPHFSFFEPTLLNTLAEKITPKNYIKGELIIKAGEPDEGLYILKEGVVKLFVMDIQNQEREVDRISIGQFFGETALLSEEPSPLSAIALNEVQVLVIDHRSAQNLIDMSSKFAREMNRLIEERNRSLHFAQGREEETEAQKIDNKDLNLPSMLGQIINTNNE